MEPEARLLVDFIVREMFPSRFGVALDLHSGFGMVDRLWFPYAYTRRPFEHVALVHALKLRLERGLPNHHYHVEPQSAQYVTHGDLWDYLYLKHQGRKAPRGQGIFLPLTLEMGSWLWIKKNPRQLFSALGIFNPVLPHRLQRTLRRHHALLDFLVRAAVSHDNWLDAQALSSECLARAMALWYPGVPVPAPKGSRPRR